MAKMQVYLPAELHARVKARLGSLNVSSVLQRALEETLAELDRRDALDRLVGEYEAKHRKFGPAELAAIEARDRAAARKPRMPRRAKKRAA
jgi:cytidylate kinase